MVKKLSIFYLLIMIFIVAGCDFSSRGAITEIANDNELNQEQSNEEAEIELETADEEKEESEDNEYTVTKIDDSASENVDVINYEQHNKSDVKYVKDIIPNTLAKDIEQNPFNYTYALNRSDELISENFDIDEDGNEEEIAVMFNNEFTEESTQYILVISDYRGNPKYAEYQYNVEAPESSLDILTVAEITGDNMMEVVLEYNSGITAYLGNGYQSLSHLTFGFNPYIGNFTKLPVLGGYYNVEWGDNLTANINEEITGFNTFYSYIENVGTDAVSTLKTVGVISDDSSYEPGNKIDTTRRSVSPERAVQSPDSSSQFDLISDEVISHLRIATLTTTNLYRWNEDYNWLEPVKSTLTDQDEGERIYDSEKEIFNVNSFNEKFDSNNVEMKDFFGHWQLNINGKIQKKKLEISHDKIIETEEDTYNFEDINETQVSITAYVYNNETGQLIVEGEINNSSHNDYNISYRNQFILMKVDGEQMLMDKYGYFYIKQDS